MNMNLQKTQLHLTFIVLLVLPWVPLKAQDVDQLSWTEIKDKWGQVLFCQRIYKMPEVRPRLYDFDIEQCNTANQLALDIVAKYSTQDQALLKSQAEQHAVRLGYNTSEPYHSVVACREYCRALSDYQEKRND
jgi:hypothetical protein